MNCPKCTQKLEGGWTICPSCQTPIDGNQANENPYSAPVVEDHNVSIGTNAHSGGNKNPSDALSTVIPYNNPKALIAYYLGIVSGLPLIGLPFGVVAFVLGIMGLRDRKRNPAIKGSVHAWIGIGCGGLFTLIWTLTIVAMIVASL